MRGSERRQEAAGEQRVAAAIGSKRRRAGERVGAPRDNESLEIREPQTVQPGLWWRQHFRPRNCSAQRERETSANAKPPVDRGLRLRPGGGRFSGREIGPAAVDGLVVVEARREGQPGLPRGREPARKIR